MRTTTQSKRQAHRNAGADGRPDAEANRTRGRSISVIVELDRSPENTVFLKTALQTLALLEQRLTEKKGETK